MQRLQLLLANSFTKTGTTNNPNYFTVAAAVAAGAVPYSGGNCF
jgi:hypothetical protein